MDDPGLVRWRGSQEYWEKLADIYSGKFRENPRSYVFVPLADALYHAGMASKAVETLEMGLAILPSNRAGMVLLARLRKEAGDNAGAKALLLDIVNRWPDNTAAVTMLCGIYAEEGLFAEAKRLASVLLDYFPDSKQVARLCGKYSALAEEHREPFQVTASQPSYTQPEPEPDLELELAELDIEQADEGYTDKSAVSHENTAGVEEAPAIVQSGATIDDQADVLYEPPGEETNGTQSQKHEGRTRSNAEMERQLTLVKLESILSRVSRLRK
ncbi:MAG: tetratricopeptide repeat protein [Nitrospinae bacterium]|nr:tetratricopeptide repeat protein [Nitrospinota bacterium]